jgi:hypothetical protein
MAVLAICTPYWQARFFMPTWHGMHSIGRRLGGTDLLALLMPLSTPAIGTARVVTVIACDDPDHAFSGWAGGVALRRYGCAATVAASAECRKLAPMPMISRDTQFLLNDLPGSRTGKSP